MLPPSTKLFWFMVRWPFPRQPRLSTKAVDSDFAPEWRTCHWNDPAQTEECLLTEGPEPLSEASPMLLAAAMTLRMTFLPNYGQRLPRLKNPTWSNRLPEQRRFLQGSAPLSCTDLFTHSHPSQPTPRIDQFIMARRNLHLFVFLTRNEGKVQSLMKKVGEVSKRKRKSLAQAKRLSRTTSSTEGATPPTPIGGLLSNNDSAKTFAALQANKLLQRLNHADCTPLTHDTWSSLGAVLGIGL